MAVAGRFEATDLKTAGGVAEQKADRLVGYAHSQHLSPVAPNRAFTR